jgi:hypothetical protein
LVLVFISAILIYFLASLCYAANVLDASIVKG